MPSPNKSCYILTAECPLPPVPNAGALLLDQPVRPAIAERPNQPAMLRRATSGLLARSFLGGKGRFFSSDPHTAETVDSNFVEAWKKVAPKVDPPKIPLSFMRPRPPTPSSIPLNLTVNFVFPYASELSCKQVDMVIIPATSGQMSVLPGHASTIAELKPGVVSVHEGSEVTKYFISGGFVYIHLNSIADVMAAEVVSLEQVDGNLVQKGLAECTEKLRSATTELEKAEAQIGVDVHIALNAALRG